MKPLLNTSASSPRTAVIAPPSRVSANPQVASHNGHVRYAVSAIPVCKPPPAAEAMREPQQLSRRLPSGEVVRWVCGEAVDHGRYCRKCREPTDQAAVSAISAVPAGPAGDRKSTRLNSSHSQISYAVFCLKKKKS